jgi:hypothetical protein
MNKLTWYASTLLLVAAIGCNNGKDTDTDETDVDTETEDTEVEDTDVEDTDIEVTADCATYCTAFQAACGTDPTAYPSEAACLSACATNDWDAGTVADTTGNTIGCRIYHAGAAVTDPTSHCGHASMFGGGQCGTVVENYCWSIEAVCTGDNAPMWTVDCATDAAAYPGGTPGDTTGDSMACRLYHLGASTLISADDHCGHAGPTGDGVCVDPI